MRTTLAVSCLLSLLASSAAASTSYLADGVNTTNITESTRFYDNMKGSKAWAPTNSHVLESTLELYQKDPCLLGDLTNRTTLQNFNPEDYDIYNPTDYTKYIAYLTASMANLRDDNNTCWYEVAANVTEYWQSYYGVFAKDTSKLAYGYNYDKSYVATLEGGQSLKVGLLMYDNFQNTASQYHATPAFEWYLKGTPHSYQRPTESIPVGGTASNGGFFADYFTNGNASVTKSTLTNDAIVTELKNAFTITENAAGEFVRETEGQIAYLGVGAPNVGHTLTCYGFELDESGMLKAIKVADSDDYLGNKDTQGGTDGYALVTLNVKQKDDGKMYLFKEDGEAYISDGYIDSIGYINTPESLKKMYAEYTSADTTLTWNGELDDVWSSEQVEATTEALPTAATGWEVYVDDGGKEHAGYYATYFDEKRKVEFTDKGEATTINLQGEVKAGGLVLSAEKNQYTFTSSASGDTLNLSGDIVKKGSAMATVKDLDVSAANLKVQSGELALTGSSKLSLNGSESVVDKDATLRIAESSTLHVGDAITMSTSGDYSGSLTGASISAMDGSNVTIAGNEIDYAEVTDTLISLKEACTLSLDFVELKGDTKIQSVVSGSVVALNKVIAHITISADATVPAEEPVMLMSVATRAAEPNVLEISSDLLSNVTLKGSLIFDLSAVDDLDSYDYVSLSFTDVSYDNDLTIQAMVNNNIVGTATAPVAGADNVFYFDTKAIPEPTTATLSLLALAALAARRRRK